MFGLFLVVLGAFFLLDEMGLIKGDFWGYFWPLLLIIIGLNIMLKGKQKDNCFSFWCGNENHKKNHKVVDDQ